ncbi:MAG: DUF5615 family PIN-like protein [Burkholderiales bacterium]|nr:DUF5615 family PIN-like protein [Phycisphaerae bacterium]
MSRLFISLYLDEDVSVLIAKLIRSRGLAALTTVDAGNLGHSDADQLAYAADHQMALLTHNRDDFVALSQEYHVAGKSHCGIIVAVRRSPYDIAHRLLSLIDHVTADEMDGQILYI